MYIYIYILISYTRESHKMSWEEPMVCPYENPLRYPLLHNRFVHIAQWMDFRFSGVPRPLHFYTFAFILWVRASFNLESTAIYPYYRARPRLSFISVSNAPFVLERQPGILENMIVQLVDFCMPLYF